MGSSASRNKPHITHKTNKKDAAVIDVTCTSPTTISGSRNTNSADTKNIILPESNRKTNHAGNFESDSNSPLPISGDFCATRGEKKNYAEVEDVIGPDEPNVTTKYIRKLAIGKGAFGEAYIVERNLNYDPTQHEFTAKKCKGYGENCKTIPGAPYVAKVMDLSAVSHNDRHYAQTEIMCLAQIQHFAIIRYYEHYILDSEDATVIIITEFGNHGDLRQNLTARRESFSESNTNSSSMRLTEREAGVYFVQLLLALHHVHSNRMIHRDVKSANLFLTSSGFMKLGDFGFSQKYEGTVSDENVAGTFLGTPYYLAPEMWKGSRYGKKADIWAMGVVLWEMLMHGNRPFEGGNLPELKEDVLNKELTLPDYPPTISNANTNSSSSVKEENDAEAAHSHSVPKFSPEMKEMIHCLFQRDPNLRPSTEELIRKPIVQHYLRLLEKHVHNLIQENKAMMEKSTESRCNYYQLHFRDDAEVQLVWQGIKEAQAVIDKTTPAVNPMTMSSSCEGVVYKEANNGAWKERYLILTEAGLTISLSKGRENIISNSRSKTVPLSMLKSISPSVISSFDNHNDNNNCTSEVNSSNVISPATASFSRSHPFPVEGKEDFVPVYGIAISTTSSSSIILGVPSKEEQNRWLNAIMTVLDMN